MTPIGCVKVKFQIAKENSFRFKYIDKTIHTAIAYCSISYIFHKFKKNCAVLRPWGAYLILYFNEIYDAILLPSLSTIG